MFRLCSNKFIGRGAPQSGTATHILHLKQLKSPRDILRSRIERDVHFVTICMEVVFPGKEFMIEKYGLVSSSELRVTSKKKISSSVIGFAGWLSQESRVTSKTSALRTQNSILRTKFWWLWYPYRWWVALCQWQTGAGDF